MGIWRDKRNELLAQLGDMLEGWKRFATHCVAN